MPISYVVGIDLGTTNSAVNYINLEDIEGDTFPLRTFAIPQFIAPGVVDSLETLPSFHYEPIPDELGPEQLKLPFRGYRKSESLNGIVGVFAREHGGKNPARLVSSAKSWLCHGGVDRTAKLLPWQAGEGVNKISPVEASSRYLKHIRMAWDTAFPDSPLHEQDIILTLPASFDEVARELTIKAAKQAGLPRVVLLEEPQAAFYAWMYRSGELGTRTENSELENSSGAAIFSRIGDSKKRIQKILVCDIGGGTTDLTLILVRSDEERKLTFHRVAVGDHLILGGDNLDLALAHHFEKRLIEEKKVATEETGKLPPRIWSVLVRLSCRIKETMLGENAPEKTTLHLPGIGSKLIGGSVSLEVSQEEVRNVLLEGFMPFVPLDAQPEKPRSGFREFGLPYASDPAISKYLARFLSIHETSGFEEIPNALEEKGSPLIRPDLVLLNGGMFAAKSLQKRIYDQIRQWFQDGSEDDWAPVILKNERLDLSVACGAACYGLVRRGIGRRISASLARTYYVGIEGEEYPNGAALCLLPARIEPGEEIELSDRIFELKLGTPVSFPLYVSSVRLTDTPGTILEVSPDEMTALPPIKTVLKTRRKKQETVKVALLGKLTEIGTMELWCKEIPEA